jgi:hypothetical protein
MSLSGGNEDREPNLAFPDSTTDIWRSEFGSYWTATSIVL